MQCDLLIKNGTIVDGTGKASFKGDIAVKWQDKVDYPPWKYKNVANFTYLGSQYVNTSYRTQKAGLW